MTNRLIFLRKTPSILYGLGYAVCLGAGLGIVAPYVWGVLQMIFGNACTAFAAFSF
jgi:hypothetical protein